MAEWPEWAASWTPTVDRRTTTIAAHPVAGLAALFDLDPAATQLGTALPVLWHWVALSEWPACSTVSVDGHPTTGSFMPPTPYPRRMWLGSSVVVTQPPTVGAEVVLEQTVVDLVEKIGSVARFAIATVSTTLATREGSPLLTETTQFAYRGNPTTSDTGPVTPVTPVTAVAGQQAVELRLAPVAPGRWSFRPDPVMLMRYSALTANGHRIHYDVPYTTQVEGYPNLLVHGPLMATVLAEVARREDPDRQIAAFSCRAQRPLFLGTTVSIVATTDGASMSLELRDDAAAANHPAGMTADVRFQ